jgi:hypothetical protein
MKGKRIRYGKTNPLALQTYCYIRAALKSPHNYIKSWRKDTKLQNCEVTAIMCVWDERENVSQAILSSCGFVDKYLVIDKNGKTIPIIKETQDQYGLNVTYYTKPNLNLKESRKYALNKIKSEWVLIQDGDEVFNTANGENNSIQTLRNFMIYPNIILKTRMNILKFDYLHTAIINNAYHPFLLHNNGGIYFGKADIPRGKGRIINLKPIYKWNLSSVKPMERLYYRHKYWKIYEQSGKASEYPSIIEFVEKYLNVQVTEEDIDKHEQKLWEKTLPYNKEIQGELPKILRNLVGKGVIK